MKLFERIFWHFHAVLLCGVFIFAADAFAQSTEQSYPTPVTTNQISGEIKARAVGDARRTSYFYTFDGAQGDVFLNVVTKNFNGDIDVFAADGLRPLTKIVVYADTSDNETGRVFYLRKPEKIILRVEGRTPNDDAATFQIKFAGSFVASTDTEAAPPAPEVKTESQSNVIVNSVGTIIGVKPKPTPAPAPPKEVAVEKPEKPKKIKTKKTAEPETETISRTEPETPPENPEENQPEKPPENAAAPEEKPEVVISENSNPPVESPPAENSNPPAPEVAAETEREKNNAKEPTEAEKLAQINLTIILKNGDKFTRPMSEVFSLNTSAGRLTVITNDGKIRNFSIFDVAQMKIE